MTASKAHLTYSPALALSGLLHGALVLGFVAYALVAPPAVPFGRSVEVSMIELPASAPVAAPARPATPKPVAMAAPKVAAAPDAMVLKREKAPEPKPVVEEGNRGAGVVAKAAQGPAGEATGREVGEMDRYLYELRVTIENRKTYPTLSRRLREAGEVLVEFKVRKDGSLENVNILRDSGFARLNDAAVQLVASLGRFRPIPDGAGQGELSVKLPIRYALE